jgi:uncharacterized protein (DUF924 family)
MTEPPVATPDDVLAFWRAAGKQKWWTSDPEFDRECTIHFGETWKAARSGALNGWQDSDNGTLALIIVLDQFTRNMFRDARAYDADPQARDVARHAIARGIDRRVPADLRQFVYMPLMHSEDIADQEQCVALFAALGETDSAKYAQGYLDIIRRFGRFPHRNAILGRVNTPEEQAYLDAPKAG